MRISTGLGGVAWVISFLLCLPGPAQCADVSGPWVRLRDAGEHVHLDNGIVAFDVVKQNGNFENLTFHEQKILAEPGYLDWIGPKNNHIARGEYSTVTSPADNGGAAAEVCVAQRYAQGGSPFDAEIHFVLRRGDSGPYCFVIFTHRKSYPAAGLGQSRWVLRLSDSIFDFINVDADRRFVLPPSDTPTKMLGPKESMMFTSGPFKGQITDKYHFYVDSGDHFVHGWTSTRNLLGCWVISGSNEAQNGGPTKQHNDAQWGRLLFKILVCGHYGARGVELAAGQDWQKIYGPWMLYLNSAATNDALWEDARRKAALERSAWPVEWMHDQAYPLANQRGTVSGQLTINDPQDPAASPANAWVGLAAPSPDWQQQANGYQFWVHADRNGRFKIPAIRAGQYTLYAFTGGVMDELRRDHVDVTPDAKIDLGDLKWVPRRFGQQLWQIGTPDRTAGEFHLGDNYRQWGLWNKFPQDFPRGVNFVIGQSHERSDWNYAQVNVNKDGQWIGTTWNILFDQPTSLKGTAILRLALAAAHNAKLGISVNGTSVDSFRTGADNAVTRAGIHGQYSEQDTFFDASLLHQGRNTISLTQSAGGNAQKSIMYDCLRLENNSDLQFTSALQRDHPHIFPQTVREAGDAED